MAVVICIVLNAVQRAMIAVSGVVDNLLCLMKIIPLYQGDYFQDNHITFA
jgi:hypothetical protein